MGEVRYRSKVSHIMKQLEELDDKTSTDDRLWQKLERVIRRGVDYSEDRHHEFEEDIRLLATIKRLQAEYQKKSGLSVFSDMLGEYLEYNEETNESTGQFFTAMSMCRITARLNLPTELSCDRHITILDPAAGSGRLMLAKAEYIGETTGMLNCLFTNIDIDRRAWVLCCMNAIIHCIPSINIRGNALTNEFYEAVAILPRYGIAEWHFVGEQGLENLRSGVKSSLEHNEEQIIQRELAVAQQDLFAGLMDNKKEVTV